MISVEQCRALLSTEIQLSDSDVKELRDKLYSTAELAFEIYYSNVDSNNGSKNPLGLLEASTLDTSI